jgi:DNA-binding NarL/FixJ family response regulator
MGDARLAARLFGSAQRQAEETKVSIASLTRFRVTQELVEEQARKAITSDSFDKEWKAGRKLTFEQTLALALKPADAPETDDVNETTDGSARREYPPAGLTSREFEVAQLVAAGLSNPRIAARLVISARTVESHVKNIVGKLELNNRVDVARWIAEHARQGDTTGSETAQTTSVHSITNGARDREPKGAVRRRKRPGRSAS